eukprot:scaffold15465_cov141-Isochrysis_galbana.AAC.1
MISQERRIIAEVAAMHHGRRRRKAELIIFIKVTRAHAKAACMLEVILGPSGSPVAFVLSEVHLEKLSVEVRKVVVDPLLAVLRIVAKVARQEQRRVLKAQSADLRVVAGVTHRAARRCQLSDYC